MSPLTTSPEGLRAEISDLSNRYPKLSDDELFIVWFMHAYLIEEEAVAASTLSGTSGDKGADAVYIDERARVVFVVQGKFRQTLMRSAEKRADVVAFAELGPILWGDKKAFRDHCEDLDPLVRQKLTEGRERLLERHYRLQLYYVTLGRCSPTLQRDADLIVRRTEGPTDIILIDGRRCISILDDYLSGVAPPVPSLDLTIETGGRSQSSGEIRRFDREAEIESWVFSAAGSELGELFKKAGIRIFARNIRGFLGNTEINRAVRFRAFDTISRGIKQHLSPPNALG